ncbi:MAG TPA: PA2779 family protein [Syntrophorhabdales bacterium]|nr:PA2779 family protein [Syntrophorhabdales bacterium]
MIKKYLVLYLACAMFVIGIAPRLEASYSASETLATAFSTRALDVEKIRTALEQKLVRQRLQDLGFSADEISTRLSELTDGQIHYFATRLDDLKVGGDGFAFVIVVLLIIALILLIVQLTGHRVVVK